MILKHKSYAIYFSSLSKFTTKQLCLALAGCKGITIFIQPDRDLFSMQVELNKIKCIEAVVIIALNDEMDNQLRRFYHLARNSHDNVTLITSSDFTASLKVIKVKEEE